jgi:hypothetical protein
VSGHDVNSSMITAHGRLALALPAVHEHMALLVPAGPARNEHLPVRRAGNLLYDYELASEQVPA